MLLNDILHGNAIRTPDKNALLMTDGSGSRTFGELDERAMRLANGLLGIAAPGDRIAILSANNIEFVEAYYGVPAAGMSLTMLNYRLHPREWAWILNNAQARVLIVGSEFYDAIAQHRGDLDTVEHIIAIGASRPGIGTFEELLAGASSAAPDVRVAQDDVAWLLYTSGTTGFPKGAQLTHRNLCSALLGSVEEYEPTAETVFLNAMPLCHVAGYLTPMHQFHGGSVLLMRDWDPEHWMAAVQKHRVTSSGFAPTMMSTLLAHPKVDEYDLASLESMGYGASKIPIEVLRRTIERFGPIVYAGMGMTELGGNILTLDKQAHVRAAHGEEHLLDSAGRPMPQVDVRVFDVDGVECEVGDVGEMVVRGDQVMKGYFGNPNATAAAFADGWFHTGDLVRRDAEGFFYLVDRMKDMIISGGENVYCSEVENAIYELASVAEAAVVGLADQVWGERVAVVVVPRAGGTLTAEEVIAACRSRLASYKCPRQVVFATELPKTVSGKIRKNDLRDQLTARQPADLRTRPASPRPAVQSRRAGGDLLAGSQVCAVAALAERLFAAIGAGDIAALEQMYRHDATVWHNYDDVEQTRAESLRLLGWLAHRAGPLRYTQVRRTVLEDGFMQQHVVELGGACVGVRMPAMTRVWTDGRTVSRIEEYVDPAPLNDTLGSGTTPTASARHR